MADISMCQSDQCSKRNQCYRQLAKASEFQTYMLFDNICHQNNNYQYFWQASEEFIIKEESDT